MPRCAQQQPRSLVGLQPIEELPEELGEHCVSSIRSTDVGVAVRPRTRVFRFLSRWFLPKRLQQPCFDVYLQEGPSRRSSLEESARRPSLEEPKERHDDDDAA